MKNKYSLYIGRWQPFHKGHELLVRHSLDQGKKVCIALRDTDKDDKNPLDFADRYMIIAKIFPEEMKSGQLRIIEIPDIEEVCYGRDVGYGINKIELDPEIEEISGTKIRENGKLK